MAQNIRLPDGQVVAFPDDMPQEEIRALIEHKYPKDVAKRANPLKAADTAVKDDFLRNAMRSNPLMGPGMAMMDAISGLEAGGGLSPQEEASGDWKRGILWPVAKNTATGERKMAVPGVVQGLYEGAKSALMLPGDVMQGKYADELDPRSGMRDISPELIGRGLNFAALTAGAGGDLAIPKAAIPKSAGAALSEKFDIPLTKGQASGDIGQLSREEMLRQTEGAGRPVIKGFDAAQQEAIEKAAGKMAPTGDAGNMPELVTQGIKNKVAFSKARAASLYRIAEDGNLVVDKQALDELPGYVRQTLETAERPVIVDSVITPSASRAMKELDEAAKLAGALRPSTPGSTAAADEVIGVQLRGLEQIRKRINALTGSTPEDIRAVSAIKRAFDGWLDDAVDQALISGDDMALDALKAARKEAAWYKGLTSPKMGDAAGRAIKNMQKVDATGEEVANWLYGANIASPSMNAPKVAARLKETFGATSPEFQSIRAGAWLRLTRDLRDGEMLSATKVANKIEDFVNAKGSTLAGVLFSDAEREKMLAFAKVLRKTVTPREATNPSRTAFTLKSMFDAGIQAAAGALGLQTGGGTGMIMGLVGVPIFRNIRSYGAAVKAITPETAKQAGAGAALMLQGAARGAALLPRGEPTGATLRWGT